MDEVNVHSYTRTYHVNRNHLLTKGSSRLPCQSQFSGIVTGKPGGRTPVQLPGGIVDPFFIFMGLPGKQLTQYSPAKAGHWDKFYPV